MRIVYVTSRFPAGPSEVFLAPEIAELKRQGHDVTVVPLNPRGKVVHSEVGDLAPLCRLRPIVSPSIAAAAVAQFLRAPLRALRALFSITTLNLRHMAKNLLAFPKALWLARTASRLGAEHIHAHWASVSSTMAMAASIVSEIPWSFTAHRWDIVENNLLTRKASHARFARFISRSGLEMATRRGILTEKTVVIHMGVSLPSDYRTGSPREPETPFTLLCPANLLPVKGHEYLIRAVALVKRDIELRIAGSGPLGGELERLAKRVGVTDRVAFMGQLPHERILAMYDSGEVDAVVLASVDLGNGLHEGIPVALVEAMAHAVPVIATATGGIPEIVREGCGILVPERDPASLAEAIERLASDRAFASSLGARGRKLVEEEFEIGAIAECLSTLFRGRGEYVTCTNAKG